IGRWYGIGLFSFFCPALPSSGLCVCAPVSLFLLSCSFICFLHTTNMLLAYHEHASCITRTCFLHTTLCFLHNPNMLLACTTCFLHTTLCFLHNPNMLLACHIIYASCIPHYICFLHTHIMLLAYHKEYHRPNCGINCVSLICGLHMNEENH
ncbi:hypothetical protein HID58_021927, partial [Brassica napus]